MLCVNLHLYYDVQYLSILIEPREHHNGPTLPVIDHLPEVSACGLQGTLGYDERLLLLVALCAEREGKWYSSEMSNANSHWVSMYNDHHTTCSTSSDTTREHFTSDRLK